MRHRGRVVPQAAPQQQLRLHAAHVVAPGRKIVLDAIGDATVEKGFCLVEVELVHLDAGAIGEGARRMLLEIPRKGDCEATGEVASPFGEIQPLPGGADIVECVTEDVRPVQPLRQLDGLSAQRKRLVEPFGQHRQLGKVRVSHGELGTVGGRLQKLDCPRPEPVRCLAVAEQVGKA